MEASIVAERALVHALFVDHTVLENKWVSRLKPEDFRDEACRIIFESKGTRVPWKDGLLTGFKRAMEQPYVRENVDVYARIILHCAGKTN